MAAPNYIRYLAASTLVTVMGIGGAASAGADPNLPYGPNTCANGLVWRAARPGDAVCVTPEDRDRTVKENATAAHRVDPHGAYGPQTCTAGFVWREAFDSDAVCVTPDTRRENLAWNGYKCGTESAVLSEQAKGGMYCAPRPPGPNDLGKYPGYLN